MDMTSAGWRDGLLIGAFVVIAALAGADATFDLDEGVSLAHVATEVTVLVIAVVSAALLFVSLLTRTRELNTRLEVSRADAARWRSEAEAVIQGFGAAVDRQFEAWTLSPAEKETGLLLLKGYAHKEIARLRGISDATARQQAMSVYRKAGVSSRNDLAAFFLEDLSLPAKA